MLKREFETFMRAVFPDEQPTDRQTKVMHDAFMAGALASFNGVCEGAADAIMVDLLDFGQVLERRAAH